MKRSSASPFRWPKITILLVVLLGLIVLFAMREAAIKSSSDTASVFIGEEGKRFIVSLPEGTLTEVPDALALIHEFKGLPDLSNDPTRRIRRDLVSLDRSKVILVVNRITGPENDIGYAPNVDEKEFTCDVETLQCAESSLTTERRKGKANNWRIWDPNKNVFIGNTSGEGAGNAVPVSYYYYDRGELMESEESVNPSQQILPGAFSSSLDRFAVIEMVDSFHETLSQQLLIFDKDEMNIPTEIIDLDPIIERETYSSYSVDTIAWSHDEKKIALGNDRAIWIFDLGSKRFKNIFRTNRISPVNGSGRHDFLPSQGLAFSDNDNFLLFVTMVEEQESAGDDAETASKLSIILNAYDPHTGRKFEIPQETGINLSDYALNVWPFGY